MATFLLSMIGAFAEFERFLILDANAQASPRPRPAAPPPAPLDRLSLVEAFARPFAAAVPRCRLRAIRTGWMLPRL